MIATIDPAAAGKAADVTAIGIEAAIELLRNAGYRVSKPRALGAVETGPRRVSRTGKGHGRCAEHYRVDGMQQPVCVLGARTIDGMQYAADDAAVVIAFAQDIAALAAASGDVLRELMQRDAAAAGGQHAQH